MNGPFTRDVSELDSVAQTVVKMREKPIEEAKLFPELDDSPDSHKKRMVHSVTRYDRKQEEAARKNPRRHHNMYALGHYLGAVDHAHEDMKKGHSPAEAINNNFNGGLARHLHKHLDTGDTDIDSKRRKSWGEETQIEEDTKSPMHEDLVKAGHKHTNTTEWNKKAAHTYEGPRNYESILDKHGFKKQPNIDNRSVNYKHTNGDHVSVKAGSGGNVKLTHDHHDPSYTYKEETEQLDELSKKTLKSYKKQALGLSFDRLQRSADSSYISGNKAGVEKAHLKMHNRAKGHTLATKKISQK